ncbi:unnamed protein product [Ceutorhynchus assimilis]|uniref:Mediator of RNA polymerase II transcription subunit 15 n=1 Tax=Ceutorhynchus assimilis TaxID=467358 RepID=A0A9N9QNQ6_9CUCU|nr:unnamed protein product [Ceutorhynchus assimilis]
MSKANVPDSWKTEKFRKSVVDKINEELQKYNLKRSDHGNHIEEAFFSKTYTKTQYLGYVAKILISIRNMVCIQDAWLENQVKEILSRPPPKLRKILTPEEMAKHNMELMRLRTKIEENFKLRPKKS